MIVVASPQAVDETADRVRAAGHTVAAGPYDAPWGHRYARLVDPDGYGIVVFCPLPA